MIPNSYSISICAGSDVKLKCIKGWDLQVQGAISSSRPPVNIYLGNGNGKEKIEEVLSSKNRGCRESRERRKRRSKEIRKGKRKEKWTESVLGK